MQAGTAEKKEYLADLHIHSRYSYAVSRDCTPEMLDYWARRKGIRLIGTGDFTHPAWREELRCKLRPAEDGFYILKEEYRIHDDTVRTGMIPRFLVTGEISSIYKKGGRTRKVHSLILLPGLEEADRIAARLEQIGNLHSDGRPILGISCRDLLELTLDCSERSMYVPAHIWTPHFALFGAKSGFDTLEECFEDLSGHIHAAETGLSSDPPMNRTVSALDHLHLISNSDAHSPSKIGREATIFQTEFSYDGVRRAVETGEGLAGTIEFFPEEGKYHLDGHRKCGVCMTPEEASASGGICPVCGKKLTMGVPHRIMQLSDGPAQKEHVKQDRFESLMPLPDGPAQKEHVKQDQFESLMPLPEALASVMGYANAGKRVIKLYETMLCRLGSEFDILRSVPIEEIRTVSDERIAEGIRRLRAGEVEKVPGYDGEYGHIKLFPVNDTHRSFVRSEPESAP